MKLEELVVDGDALDEKQVIKVLRPYVRFDKKSGEVRFMPAGSKLSKKNKVLLFLLAEKARELLQGVPQRAEALSPSLIEKSLHIDGNTLRPILKRLKEEGFIGISGGGYFVHTYALHEIEKLFTRKGGETSG